MGGRPNTKFGLAEITGFFLGLFAITSESFELILIRPFFLGLGLLEIQRAARHVEVLRLALAGEQIFNR